MMKIRLILGILDRLFRSFPLSICFTAKNATISNVQDVCQKKSTPSIVHTVCSKVQRSWPEVRAAIVVHETVTLVLSVDRR